MAFENHFSVTPARKKASYFVCIAFSLSAVVLPDNYRDALLWWLAAITYTAYDSFKESENIFLLKRV
jgi:hypothetical protein